VARAEWVERGRLLKRVKQLTEYIGVMKEDLRKVLPHNYDGEKYFLTLKQYQLLVAVVESKIPEEPKVSSLADMVKKERRELNRSIEAREGGSPDPK
jgi:hypothetical protein